MKTFKSGPLNRTLYVKNGSNFFLCDSTWAQNVGGFQSVCELLKSDQCHKCDDLFNQ